MKQGLVPAPTWSLNTRFSSCLTWVPLTINQIMAEEDIFSPEVLQDLLDEEPRVFAQMDSSSSSYTPPAAPEKKKRKRATVPKTPQVVAYPKNNQLDQLGDDCFNWDEVERDFPDNFLESLQVAEPKKIKKRVVPVKLSEEVLCPVCKDSIPRFYINGNAITCQSCALEVYSHVKELRRLPSDILHYYVTKYLTPN